MTSPTLSTHSSPSTQVSSSQEAAQRQFLQSIKAVIALQNRVPPIERCDRNQPLPLSFPQERLWMLDQLSGADSAYNIPLAFSLSGALDIDALEQSLQEIILRHESLRTRFFVSGGAPVQDILPDLEFKIQFINLCHLPAEQREQNISTLATSEANHPFDLNQAPLMRATLLKLEGQEHVFLLTLHHIIFDGWSEGILLGEISAFYRGLTAQQAAVLPPLMVHYPDYSNWQRCWLQGELQETLLNYWGKQLDAAPYVLRLPVRPDSVSSPCKRSRRQLLQLSPVLSQQLQEICKQEGKTLFVFMLTAFQVLLSQYTGQIDVRVCTAVANRNRKELTNLIGYFANLLVIRSHLSSELNFQDALDRVHRSVTGAFAHQDLPIQCLAQKPGFEQIAFAQVLFILQNTPSSLLQLDGVKVERLEIDTETTADFDLFLAITNRSEGLQCKLTYNSDLFEAAQGRQLLAHYQQLLEQIVMDTRQPLGTLCPLSDMEQQQLHVDHNYPLEPSKSAQRPISKTVQGRRNPNDPIELRLLTLWKEVLGQTSIGVTDNFFELGGGSLRALNLFNLIEKVFNRKLPLSALLQAPTIEQLAILIKQEQTQPWQSLVPIQTNGSQLPLFCIHGKGANILVFKALADLLRPDQPLFGLQQVRVLQGQQVEGIEDMAARYIDEIRTVQPQGPYRLAGFSLGGVIAFEIAQQLQLDGEEISFVGLFDTYGPNCFLSLNFWEKIQRHSWNLFRIGPKYLVKMTIKYLEYYGLLAASQVCGMLGRSLTPQQQKLTFGRALVAAEQNYEPQVYSGRLTLFRASDIPGDVWYYRPGGMPTPEDWRHKDPLHGWGPLAQQGVNVIDVPGHHSGMLKEPNVRILAQELDQCLKNSCV